MTSESVLDKRYVPTCVLQALWDSGAEFFEQREWSQNWQPILKGIHHQCSHHHGAPAGFLSEWHRLIPASLNCLRRLSFSIKTPFATENHWYPPSLCFAPKTAISPQRVPPAAVQLPR